MEYRLDQLFDLQMGKTPSRNNPEYWDSDDHKWISIADLSKCGKFITDTKECLSDRAVVETGISLIPANTVVMSFKLSIGKVAITSEPMYSNEAIMSFRDKGVTELDPHYLYYLFAGKDWDAGTNKAVMGKTLNKATLSKIVVDIRPIEEQREVVRVLDKAQEIIEARQAQLQKLDELVKARFVEMFGAYEPCHSIDDACVVLSGFAFKSTHYVDDGIRIMRIANVQKGYIEDKMPCYYPAVDQNAAVNYALREDDLLVSLTGNVGRVGLMTKELLPAALNQRVACLRPKNSNRLDIRYLFALLNLDEFEDAAIEASSGSAQKNLSIKWLKSHRIAIPPSGLQSAFSAFCKQVDKSGAAVRKALEEAQLLFDSLMQKYFG